MSNQFFSDLPSQLRRERIAAVLALGLAPVLDQESKISANSLEPSLELLSGLRLSVSQPDSASQTTPTIGQQRIPVLKLRKQFMKPTRKVNSKNHCAIYTRKSVEEGLELDFNSLHTQRESAELFIAGQQHEGWECLPEHYDDGSFSGSSLDRPALNRLLEDIKSGKIDCVVVYKVDRLSRSARDLARIMETFDEYGVCFVSVSDEATQR